MSLTKPDIDASVDQDAPCQHCATSRRNMLGMTALAGATTVGLAACGGSGSQSAASTGAPASPTGAPTVAMTTAQLAVGAKAEVRLKEDKAYLFYRESDTVVKAYRAVCTHAGCLVGVGTGKEFACPCHGSMYDPATGAPTAGPAPRPLEAFAAKVEGSNIVIYLEG